jgi:hypothetical protein
MLCRQRSKIIRFRNIGRSELSKGSKGIAEENGGPYWKLLQRRALAGDIRQSQSLFATGQSACMSWCGAPSGAHDQILHVLWSDIYVLLHVGRPL